MLEHAMSAPLDVGAATRLLEIARYLDSPEVAATDDANYLIELASHLSRLVEADGLLDWLNDHPTGMGEANGYWCDYSLNFSVSKRSPRIGVIVTPSIREMLRAARAAREGL